LPIGNISKSNKKNRKMGQKSNSDTEIDVHPLSWLDTDTSRKSGGVKLLLWAHGF
jgi:hypothetical protein